MMRKIVLCADDYGLSPGVSRGIRELLEMRRLSAASCMVMYPEFSQDGPLLREFYSRADVGLHFTLTTDQPLSSVLLRGWLRRLDVEHIRRQLWQQVDAFTSVIGQTPRYIDGHQHVHLLPGVCQVVVEAAAQIGAYVRVTREPVVPAMLERAAPVDSAYLSWASYPLARLAARRRVPTNTGFRGVRSFRERELFRELFRKMIAGVKNGSIVMCHPGHVDERLTARDPIHRQREEEFAYLACEDFPRDLAATGLELATLREALTG